MQDWFPLLPQVFKPRIVVYCLTRPFIFQMNKKRTLVVDDESGVRRFLADLLEAEQIRAVEAESATHALQILQDPRNRIDLIITDIQMAGEMDGVDLAHSVARTYPTVPVILISSHRENVPADFAFVQKPFTPQAILMAIRDAMPGGGQS